jgi:AraC-like DNA-binding protein
MPHHSEIINNAHFEEQYRFVPPHNLIADVVEFYWQLDLRNGRLNEEFTDQIFANLNTSVVFNLGSEYTLTDKHTNSETVFSRSIIIGHHTHVMQYQHFEGNFLFGIKLKPAGFNMLFGISAAELTNDFTEAEFFFRSFFVEERLYDCSNINERKMLLDSILIALLSSAKQNHRILSVHTALTGLVIKNRIYNVRELAAALHLTPRSLERYFKEAMGISPKTCLAIIRFREALKKMHAGNNSFYADESGYYDLSHFIKDYRKFLNMGD